MRRARLGNPHWNVAARCAMLRWARMVDAGGPKVVLRSEHGRHGSYIRHGRGLTPRATLDIQSNRAVYS
jgi:hypothetical protein